MGFIGRFNTGATNAITDLVALLHQGIELRLRDRLGVSQSMGSEAAMGIKTQDVDVHLRPRQRRGLLAETQDLFWLQIQQQGRAVAVPICPTFTSLIQQQWVQIQQ